ncbi:MAG: glycosyltransferase [Clostridia bacterium]|nr:glycosyltransferase [Clostridia bacterium]
MNALVSIIVPVYNLEGYIDNCLKSLVNQTYRNLEILCIDDGSTDRSADVIKSFSEKDSRIIYVYKENGGVSSARNLGLDMFKGEYVMFVDGDDFLHPQAVEIMLVGLVDLSMQISVCNVLVTDKKDYTSGNITSYESKDIGLEELFKSVEQICLLSSCNKIYSKHLVSSNRFDETLSRSEDTLFFFNLLKKVNKACYVDETLYYYYLRQGSATRIGFDENMPNTLEAYSVFCEDLLREKSKRLLLNQILIFLYKYLFVLRTLCIGTKSENKVLNECKRIGSKWISFVAKDELINFKNRVLFIIFFYSRHLYELARLITDPTMIDFYKNRRKHNGDCQKD